MTLTVALLLLGYTCAYAPQQAYSVMTNTTTQMHCVAQNYAQMMTDRYLSGLQDGVQRNAEMFQGNVVSAMHGMIVSLES